MPRTNWGFSSKIAATLVSARRAITSRPVASGIVTSSNSSGGSFSMSVNP